MRGSVWAALALLAALLVGAIFAPRPPSGSLPIASGGVLVLLVEPTRTAPRGGAWGVVPGRDLETAYRTGRLRPEPGATTLGPALRQAGVRTVAVGAAAARLLAEREVPVGNPVAPLGPGVCVVADWIGPLPEPPAGAVVIALPMGVLPGQSLPPVTMMGAGSGALASPSTRTVGLIAATDIPATVAKLLGKDMTVGVGRAAGIVPGGNQNLERRVAAWERQDDEQALRRFLPWTLAVVLGLGIGLSRRELLLAAASAPLALAIAPVLVLWTDARWAVYVVAASGMGLVAALALRLSTRGLMRGLAWATLLIYTVDGLSGGFLLVRSPLSWAPVEAARFYGIGNEAAGAWLGAAGALAALEGMAVGGLVLAGAAVGIGAPGLGANAGGALAALVGLVVHSAVGLPPQRRWKALVVGAVVVLGLTALVALRDSAQGAGRRSHIGEAAASAQERGGGALVVVATRKAALNLRLLVGSPWSVLLLVGALGMGCWRRARTPGLLAVDIAVLVLNDSGVLASSVCGLWLAGVRVVEHDKVAAEPELRATLLESGSV